MLKAFISVLLLGLLATACGMSAVGVSNTPTSVPSPLLTVTATVAVTPTMTAMPTASPTSTTTPTPTASPTPGPETRYDRLVVVDQQWQMMYVYEHGEMIRAIPCSTGKPGEETYTPAWEGEVGRYVGTFFSFGTYQDEGWYLFEHYGSMLIHGNPYIVQGGEKVYQELDALGNRAASHGCIRLPPQEAAWFTAWKPRGAHVIIGPPPS